MNLRKNLDPQKLQMLESKLNGLSTEDLNRDRPKSREFRIKN
jgi:hypothetical protein